MHGRVSMQINQLQISRHSVPLRVLRRTSLEEVDEMKA